MPSRSMPYQGPKNPMVSRRTSIWKPKVLHFQTLPGNIKTETLRSGRPNFTVDSLELDPTNWDSTCSASNDWNSNDWDIGSALHANEALQNFVNSYRRLLPTLPQYIQHYFILLERDVNRIGSFLNGQVNPRCRIGVTHKTALRSLSDVTLILRCLRQQEAEENIPHDIRDQCRRAELSLMHIRRYLESDKSQQYSQPCTLYDSEGAKSAVVHLEDVNETLQQENHQLRSQLETAETEKQLLDALRRVNRYKFQTLQSKMEVMKLRFGNLGNKPSRTDTEPNIRPPEQPEHSVPAVEDHQVIAQHGTASGGPSHDPQHAVDESQHWQQQLLRNFTNSLSPEVIGSGSDADSVTVRRENCDLPQAAMVNPAADCYETEDDNANDISSPYCPSTPDPYLDPEYNPDMGVAGVEEYDDPRRPYSPSHNPDFPPHTYMTKAITVDPSPVHEVQPQNNHVAFQYSRGGVNPNRAATGAREEFGKSNQVPSKDDIAMNDSDFLSSGTESDFYSDEN
ncbi:hypothetical protein QBC43DRAFT_293848 [Cladorrhinum sp. PSN259]|nr:hypothetical protein QBC43DRAFT_293848 [Cladorrhinum sp. PSN259]